MWSVNVNYSIDNVCLPACMCVCVKNKRIKSIHLFHLSILNIWIWSHYFPKSHRGICQSLKLSHAYGAKKLNDIRYLSYLFYFLFSQSILYVVGD